MNFDFSGWATKHNIKCSDGRTIAPDAFKDCDGLKVPLVWQHQHNDPGNILGHATLETRPDGVYAYGTFNDSEPGKLAKELVQHGDISSLSIYANKLVEKSKNVLHGQIREVSLVLSGANPGALIDNVVLAHGDGYDVVEDEAIIYSGAELSHSDDNEKEAPVAETKDSEKTVQDVFNSMSDEQKHVVYYMIGAALEAENSDNAQHSDTDYDEETLMHNNIFEGSDESTTDDAVLSHADMETILTDAKKNGSLKEAFLAHAGTYGIDEIDILFPDAKALSNTPDFIKRRTDWVSTVLNGTRHTPFSRIKSMQADITADEARAKGYIKGNLKKEEVFRLLKRVTTPTTIYKKQKLDRDDIIDITDFDVVVWLKAEMRLMLDEEIARAVMIGDGREITDEDKISEEHIRPIAKDDDLYAHKVVLKDTSAVTIFEQALRSRTVYEGSGNPTMFTTSGLVADMLLEKDTQGRRLYETEEALRAALRVSSIVEVPIMDGFKYTNADGKTVTPVAILVNLNDYVIGADRGGAVSMFDDFDIDYNQQKYLIETRISGALVKPKTALVFQTVSA